MNPSRSSQIDQYFQDGHRPDTEVRFEFEIIKHLSESIRAQTEMISRMQTQQADILVRLERIEAKEHGEQLAACIARITVLEEEYQRRQGRDGLVAAFFRSPVVAWVVLGIAAVYTVLKDKV